MWWAERGLQHMQDRLALRQSCRVLMGSIPYGGLHLSFPMSRQHLQSVPFLADRPAVRKLAFEQTCPGRVRKRAFKTLLSRLGPAVGQDRRYAAAGDETFVHMYGTHICTARDLCACCPEPRKEGFSLLSLAFFPDLLLDIRASLCPYRYVSVRCESVCCL